MEDKEIAQIFRDIADIQNKQYELRKLEVSQLTMIRKILWVFMIFYIVIPLTILVISIFFSVSIIKIIFG